jgi:hypothetical protein
MFVEVINSCISNGAVTPEKFTNMLLIRNQLRKGAYSA